MWLLFDQYRMHMSALAGKKLNSGELLAAIFKNFLLTHREALFDGLTHGLPEAAATPNSAAAAGDAILRRARRRRAGNKGA